MFSNTPAASSKFFVDYYNRMHDERPWLNTPNAEAQRLASNYDYYKNEFLPNQFSAIKRGTVGPGDARFGEYTYKSSDASKKIANTPGAGLWAVGIDYNSPDAERQAQAFIDNNTNRQYEGLRMTSGNWGRADAELPNLQKLKAQNPNASAKDLLDYQLRGGHFQSSLAPRSFDIADILLPVGQIALGALTGGPWASAALGGAYGASTGGLPGFLLGGASGFGGGTFGADIASQGLKGAIGSQISGFKNFLSNPSGVASSALPTTPAGVLKTATNIAGNVPSSWATSGNANRGIGSVLPTVAFGAQTAGAFKSAPANITPKVTPAPVVQKPLAPQMRPKPMNTAAPVGPVKPLAEGGFLENARNPMNPMGGPPVSAHGLASFGRGGDTTLMHVSPGEVQALQKLAEQHGGSLTINPKTGLPEAGFLESILPAIVGIGAAVAAPFTAGTSLAALGPLLSNPLAMGLLTGGVTGLVTGDLKKGLLGGLGAYGGASLAGSLGLGTAAAGAGAGSAGAAGAGGEAIKRATESYFGATPAAEAAASNALFSSPSAFSLAPNAASSVTPGLTAAGNAAIRGATENQFAQMLASKAAPGAFGLTGGKGLLASGAAALAPAMFEKPTPITPRDPWGGKGVTSPYEGPWEFKREAQFPGADRALTDSSEFDYFGPGYYESATGRRMASGGITSLGPVRTHKQFAEGGSLSEFMALKHGGTPHKGGYLDGPGDGMSDSIPATIEDKQPARLADGEFVVPADVVSHIGNGSSKAGAKRLYSMMDKIRHARTGNKKQGKQINPDKYLPA